MNVYNLQRKQGKVGAYFYLFKPNFYPITCTQSPLHYVIINIIF